MVNRSHRIAMVAYTLYASDPRIKRHVAALTSEGYEVDVFALSGSENEEPCPGLRFFYSRSRRYDRQGKFRILSEYILFAIASAFLMIRNHFRDGRYALVHINNMPNFLIFAALPLRLLGVPVLLDVHDTMPEIYQEKFGVTEGHWLVRSLLMEERLCMKLANYVITTEHTKWERLLTNGLRREGSTVTLNLPDSDLFPEPDLPHEMGARGGAFRVVYHGTLARRLGLDLAVRAVAQVRDRVPGIVFDIIGDGEHRPELIELAEGLGVADAVRFSDGFVPTEEIPSLLDGADLAILPSRDVVATRYMLPTKLLEYIRLGIPCVTVATHTIVHYFSEPAVQFVPSEDVDALANKIAHLFANPEERLETARAARAFFDRYSFAGERRVYLDVVANLIGRDSAEADPLSR